MVEISGQGLGGFGRKSLAVSQGMDILEISGPELSGLGRFSCFFSFVSPHKFNHKYILHQVNAH
jgi:hypothetical protein